jgi:hypothetical protein
MITLFKINLQLFKKGGSTTNVQTYTPTEQEIGLQQQALDYSKAVSPNALNLNTLASGLINQNYGTVAANYGGLTDEALAQNQAAYQGLQGLSQGELPSAYLNNMSSAIKSGVQNTVGNTLNNLANRGVLNSSVTSDAMNEIGRNVSDTMAGMFNQNVNQLGGVYESMINNAGNPLQLTAAGQEAALNIPSKLWDMSLGLNSGGTTSTLGAIGGKGTTTSTVTQPKSSFLSGLFGF